jgi:hypothetical protein
LTDGQGASRRAAVPTSDPPITINGRSHCTRLCETRVPSRPGGAKDPLQGYRFRGGGPKIRTLKSNPCRRQKPAPSVAEGTEGRPQAVLPPSGDSHGGNARGQNVPGAPRKRVVTHGCQRGLRQTARRQERPIAEPQRRKGAEDAGRPAVVARRSEGAEVLTACRRRVVLCTAICQIGGIERGVAIRATQSGGPCWPGRRRATS